MSQPRMWKWALALASVLSGCAAIAPAPGDAARSTAIQTAGSARAYADRIDLTGRISLRYQANGKEEALHGSFVWTQQAGRTNVTLLSPLGQTMALIEVRADGATLTQGGQPPRNAADVDALVADTLGWPLPVSGLRDWLQGFAVDAGGNRFIAQPPASEVVTRDGWRIGYNVWQDARPKRIDLERQTAQAGNVSIRIVLDTWQ